MTNKKETLYPFVQGERIYLREVRPSDVDESYYQWMNDPEVTRFLESRFRPNDIDSLRTYVEQASKDKSSIFLAVVLKESGRHIGNIKLGPIDWIHRLADVGVLIGEKDCWGKGYATEAIGLVAGLAFGRLNLHKLTAGSYSANRGSQMAFQKNGFVVEGTRRQHRFSEGAFTDTVIMGLLNEKGTEEAKAG
jgi:[ribosomal protein S5]-alanine N-acetyltransferase